MHRRRSVRLAALLALPGLAAAQARVADRFAQTTAMIPMRDGVRLYTEIYVPRSRAAAVPMPIVFVRTPYGTKNGSGGPTRHFDTTFRVLAERDWAFVVQDARGRFGSEGTFEWNRPVRHRDDPTAIDASTDAYDSIDWLVKNVAGNNGRVGMLGVSYPGWYVTMALVDPHPALAAASPQASPSDYFLGDDFYHWGAFRLGPASELPYLFDFDKAKNSRFPFDQVDTYEFFLDLGPIAGLDARYLHGASPTWTSFLAHPTYDAFWQKGSALPHFAGERFAHVTVPTLHVVGWWDAENLGGALDLWAQMEKRDDRGLSKLVVGPWSHGQWAQAAQKNLGAYEFGADTSEWYQREVEAPWFAHWLVGDGEDALPQVSVFQTGTNRWQQFAEWPPRGNGERSLYLHADGSLAFAPPAPATATAAAGAAEATATGGGESFVAWISDPQKPVPYSKRPIMPFWSGLPGSRDERFQRAGKLWKVEDQRFVADRPDVVAWTSPPLDDDVVLQGRVQAVLFASTSGTDSDWVVKLVDVYPETFPEKPELGGYQLMIADDVLRGRFRGGFDRPKAATPGEIDEYRIDLRTRNHCFRKGHRIAVQVQSTWFPLIDRNPQRFVDIPTATAADFQRAEQRVWCTAARPSRIVFDAPPR